MSDVFPGIYLGNCEERALANPGTFEIPNGVKRRRLRVGDFAKIMFLSRVSRIDCNGERMWVKITARSDVPFRYVGEVDNEAVFLPVPFGGVVEFGPEHILEIDFARSEPAG